MPTAINIEIDEFQADRLERLMEAVEDGIPQANQYAATTALALARQRVGRVLDDMFLGFQSLEGIAGGGFETDQTLLGFFGDGPLKASIIQELASRERSTFGLRISGQRLPLREYSPRETDEGVEYYAAGWQVREDAFIVQERGGHVYKREGSSRYPIEKQYGPSPAEMFEPSIISEANDPTNLEAQRQSEVVDQLVNTEMIRFYVDEFDQQFEFILRRGETPDEPMTAGIDPTEFAFSTGRLERG